LYCAITNKSPGTTGQADASLRYALAQASKAAPAWNGVPAGKMGKKVLL
jgi:hypothetical protein